MLSLMIVQVSCGCHALVDGRPVASTIAMMEPAVSQGRRGHHSKDVLKCFERFVDVVWAIRVLRRRELHNDNIPAADATL